ncbi:MAG: hypothetical protein M3O76_02895 [Actinomycetota bacterium]|nr:hypothetical protein [Actinomycetota bacterium]
MSRRTRRSNATGAGNGRRAPLGVRPPSFVPSGPEQREQALVALRALYRDHLESLDSGAETSVDQPDEQATRRSG